MSNFKKALRLFFTFLKIGAFTFGGGYAMIPLIQHEVSVKNEWITDDDILEIVAIAESTPGPIAVNSATFVGYRVCGFLGSLFATVGVVIPSFVIILAISFVLKEFESLRIVKYAFTGIRAGVLALLFKALVSTCKKTSQNSVSYAIISFAAVLGIFTDINTFLIIIMSAIIGLVTHSLLIRRNGGK